MVNIFSRSWMITKLSFSIMNKDKELLLFPVFSGIFLVIFVIAMLFPTVISAVLSKAEVQTGTSLFYLSVFIIYFGLAFIATFFNVCVVYTTKKRFEGGNATFMESIKFGFSKIYLIFLWSLLSASVGLLLRILDNVASRMGKGGELIMRIVIGLLGMAWSILTIFVVPGLVYYDLKPFAAVKKSTEILKKTWGDSLIRYYGLGLMQFLVLLLGVILFIGLFIVLGGLGVYVILALILFAILYFVFTILIFNVANSVYNTALFVYADSGKIPEGFDSEVVEHAFNQKNKSNLVR